MDDDGRVDPAPKPDNHIVTQAPGLSTAHNAPRPPGGPHLSAPTGGCYAELSFGSSPGRAGGGGLRGEITEFSRASRRRMMRLLNSINRNKINPPLFVTLTYPDTWPESRQKRKSHLDAFRKRLERLIGQFPAVWRLEFIDRKSGSRVGEYAPHFHLLIWPPRGHIDYLRLEISRFWYEVVCSGNPDHLSAGTRVEELRSWRGANMYASKYVAKLEKLAPGVESPGRFWGVWRKELLPISWETWRVTVKEAIKLRRVLRKYAGLTSRSDLSTISCFVGFQTSNRLLAWLGIIGTPPDDVLLPG